MAVTPALSQASIAFAGAMTFLFAPVAGYLSDGHGRKVTIIWPRVLLMPAIVPLCYWLSACKDATALLAVAAIITLLSSISGATSPIGVPEVMPIAICATGVSLIYAIAVAVFGVTAQFVMTWTVEMFDPAAPAYHVVISGLVSLVAMLMTPETRGFDVKR